MTTEPVRIPLRIEEPAGLVRAWEPIRLGVPLPKGVLHEEGQAELRGTHGEVLPLQSRALAYWPDQSIKWMLVQTLISASPHERKTVTLCVDGPKLRPASVQNEGAPTGVVTETIEGSAESPHIELERRDRSYCVDTGVAEFVISESNGALIDAVRVNGQNLLAATGARLRLAGCTGRTYRAVATSLQVEERGALQVVLVADGHFETDSGSGPEARRRAPLKFKASLRFTAGASTVQLELRLHNPQAARHAGGLWDLDDSGTLLFEDLSLALEPARPASALQWYAEDPEAVQTDAPDGWSLYQDSSGGQNWDSDNHVDGQGHLTVAFRGYRVKCGGATGPTLVAEGDRATPYASVVTEHGTLAATVLGFWQNFPKALRWQSERLEIGLFPAECEAPFALQGGEQKTHTILLEFVAPGEATHLPTLQQPLEASVDPAAVEQSGALRTFVAAARDDNHAWLQYINAIVDGPHRFELKRELVDEYGWRHFGDVYADHEAVDHEAAKPFVSHYNNQYDYIHGALIHFLRTGDIRWWQSADPAAHHMVDIDIYHTDEDRAAFNHGMFWHTDHYKPAQTATHRTYSRRNSRSRNYGGGPSNEHNYSSGLALYYYLTGRTDAAQAVQELAEWVIAMDDGTQTALAEPGPTGLASKSVEPGYHKPGRGAGNSINALLDARQLTGEPRFLDKAEELIRRCIHPRDDIEALGLTEPELRWSYLAFLQVLGKYLHLKLEWDDVDDRFHYACASLLHYARWMQAHEVPYADVLDKVELPTETWPAQDIRKCHVLHIAAEFAPAAERFALHEKAGFFFERSLSDLLTFETAWLTRPLVIMSVFGYVHAYYQHHADDGVELAPGPTWFGKPRVFVPQQDRAELPAKLRLLATKALRAGVERLEMLGRFSRPTRL